MVNWKIIAIVFIVLFIVISCIFGWSYYIGNKWVKNDLLCSQKCNLDNDCEAYIYDWYTKLCVFYKDNEPIKEIKLE